MSKGRCVGLLGGLGVAAGIHYYKGLAQAHEQRGATLDLVMAHVDLPRVLETVQSGDRDGLADYLLGFFDRLEAAGVEYGVIPSVTTHFCIRELIPKTRLPLFNIFDPLRKELAARSISRVALFGTRYVMNSKLYGMVPEVEIAPAHAEEAAYIDSTYTELALRGRGTEEQYDGLTRVAETLLKRDSVEAIVFAGTDLSCIFNDSNTQFPNLDCAALHIASIADGLLAEG